MNTVLVSFGKKPINLGFINHFFKKEFYYKDFMGDKKVLSIITHLLGIVTGFIGALIVYLVTKQEVVKNHAREALNWQISVLIYSLILGVISTMFIGEALLGLAGLLNIVFCIVAAVKANSGEVWKYPITIRFLKG